jgi:hypothetical protein
VDSRSQNSSGASLDESIEEEDDDDKQQDRNMSDDCSDGGGGGENVSITIDNEAASMTTAGRGGRRTTCSSATSDDEHCQNCARVYEIICRRMYLFAKQYKIRCLLQLQMVLVLISHLQSIFRVTMQLMLSVTLKD